MMKNETLAEGILTVFSFIALVIGIVFYAGFLPDAENLIYGDVFYVVFALVAAVFGIIAVRTYTIRSPEGKLLLLLTLVPILDAIAGIVWAVYELGLGIIGPFPSPADAIWFLFYIAGISAFVYALKKVRKFVTLKNVLISSVAGIALISFVYSFSLKTIFADSEATFLYNFLSAMYPVGDVILGTLALLLFLSLKGSKLGNSWRMFVLAYWVYAIADLLYTYQIYAGTFKSGSVIDIFWWVGQLLMAIGFYQQIRLLSAK